MKIILSNKINLNLFSIVLISALPLSILMGSAIINSFVILIDFLFLIELTRNKNIKYLNNKLFYAFIFFWLSLWINVFFSDYPGNSMLRALGFIRFIFLVFAIKYYFSLNNYFYKEKIFQIWFIIFLLVSGDLIFEFFFGFNTLGYNNNFPGRLSGFLDQELKIGHFYYGFVLITLSFIFYKFKNLPLLFFFISFFLIISFLIGERSNFIRTFLILSFFTFFINKKLILKKIFFIFTLLIVIGSIIFFHNDSKERFYTMLINPLITNLGVSSILKHTHYGAHYDTAIKIFRNNIIFGIGLKNFRHESGKKKYINNEYQYNAMRQTTHPHQIHFELLSEVGLFGYLSFLGFFTYYFVSKSKKQTENNKLYRISGILFVLSIFIPLLPSGSFFTTYGATIFWINFSMIETFNN